MKTMISVEQQAIAAKKAAKTLSLLSENEKNEALNTLADHIEKNVKRILEANEADLHKGREKGFDEAYMDRLALSESRVLELAKGLREVSRLDDPTGDILSEWTLENGLHVQQVRVPLGVIGMIYEARPNVTADAAGLALKSGNAIVLKGGSSSINSNRAIVEVLHEALRETKIPAEAVQFIDSTDRAAAQQLFTMKEHIDVLIPRGGAKLISAVVSNATVPVLETGTGNCHLYIDKEADLDKALKIIVNAKTDRPAVCNAAETLIIHEDWLKENSSAIAEMFAAHSITVHGDEKAAENLPDVIPANEQDWSDEYLSLDIAIKVVSSLDEALEHIERYGTKHSEAIITENKDTAHQFMAIADAAALYHNASTRFTDGSALGFGAEIGISTQKLHARGPMGLPALTTVKYLMHGTGQTR
ncbi:glutamate-5-semialdehyde dehydrogenase [Fictibacillus aquaticus]|uniref:Gamma-glutamyl phosphate reductase n=1 Tax=Fictibacillus aquaticus TaxID=2021314 RepID=A0A235FE62_9BACL|nr:glutamate-5-semialdehyde dehydrogenase [Fictibacillus aquaticus]OYD59263.1 glutamate-5-semialdehyde dehydrogenase [Fictibacillus aquaticus]